MYVTRLQLENIRCFDRLDIKFDKPGASILVIGDNGDGKSTVLRSLAMGLCDESSAAALFRELSGEYIRHNSRKDGIITVDLSEGARDHYRVITKIKSLKAFERVEQEIFRLDGRRQK